MNQTTHKEKVLLQAEVFRCACCGNDRAGAQVAGETEVDSYLRYSVKIIFIGKVCTECAPKSHRSTTA